MNTAIDVIGALLSVASAYFYIKEKPVAWLISLVAIPFDAIMDLRIGVYGDFLLQFLYFILLIYGWHSWRRGTKTGDGLPVVSITLKQLYSIGLLTLLLITAVCLSLRHYTNSEVALLDASVTVLSLLSIWLLGRKIIESWLLWIFVDCLYVALYVYKQMPFHAFVSLIDAVACVVGYLYWMKEYGNLLGQANLPDIYEERLPNI